MFAFLGASVDAAAQLTAHFRWATSGTLQSRFGFLGLDEGLCEEQRSLSALYSTDVSTPGRLFRLLTCNQRVEILWV